MNQVHHRHNLKRRYGLTPPLLRRLTRQQQNRCLICLQPVPLQVDHCHQTQRIRGLLCMQCNLALGLFEDDLSRLHRAIRYLEGKCTPRKLKSNPLPPFQSSK